MLEGRYQKPLEKDESFRMNREELSQIREGDLIESRFRKVVFVDEEKREELLKSLEKESVIAKRDIESMRVGVSMDDKGVRMLEERYGPFFRTEREKGRVMYMHPYSGGVTLWVGPPELTVEDAAAFKHVMQSGEPRPARFEKCRPIEMIGVKRLLDS